MESISNNFSICIVSHNGYGAISGGSKGFIGGVEWQTSLLARWLARRGHRVSFVTWNEGGPGEEAIDGVRVLKICRQKEGLPGLRFFHPKWTSLLRTLRQANADVYFQNCGDCVTGQMALWCRANRKRLIFYLASNADSDPKLPELKSWRERFLYRRGLALATAVLSQTRTQQEALQQHFGRSSEILPMPCLDPGAGEFSVPSASGRRIVWVGRVCAVKRPELFLDLAEFCPNVHFDLVGPLYDDDLCRRVRARAGRIPNLSLLGQVAKKDLPELYRKASALCCTSKYEGFPNTFLEAWSYGLPLISTFDPDGIVARHGLGRIGGSVTDLASFVRQLLGSPHEYAQISGRTRDYFLRFHTADAVLPRLETFMHRIIEGADQRCAGQGVLAQDCFS